jgi:hypothetical protein
LEWEHLFNAFRVKSTENGEEILKILELFIYEEEYCITISCCENVLKKATLKMETIKIATLKMATLKKWRQSKWRQSK